MFTPTQDPSAELSTSPSAEWNLLVLRLPGVNRNRCRRNLRTPLTLRKRVVGVHGVSTQRMLFPISKLEVRVVLDALVCQSL